MKGRGRSWVMIAAGAIISGIFLWLTLRQVNGAEVLSAFGSANYLFVILSAAALVAGLVLRAMRWRLIAGAPPEAQQTYRRATNLGALANMILPARAGEFVRIFTLSQLSGSRLVNAVASSVLDRLVDVVALLLCAVALYFSFPSESPAEAWLLGIVAASIVIVGAVVALAVATKVAQPMLSRIGQHWLGTWRLRPDIFVMELRREAHELLGGWLSIKFLSVVLLVLVADFIAIWGQLSAFHIEAPIVATVLLWVFLSLSSMLPSAPGYIGVYQTAAIWAFSVYGVPASEAVAVAVLLQASTLGVTILMAGPSFARLLRSALAAKRIEEQR